MTTRNTTFTATVGATGSTIDFTFYGPRGIGPFDSNGLANLTGLTVTATVRDRISDAILVNASPCTVAPNQTTNKSQGTWVMPTDAINLPADDYKLKFKFTDSNGKDWFIPTHPRIQWFTLKMIDP